jgi:hypothetical protein
MTCQGELLGALVTSQACMGMHVMLQLLAMSGHGWLLSTCICGILAGWSVGSSWGSRMNDPEWKLDGTWQAAVTGVTCRLVSCQGEGLGALA